jgi:hypothetical protein
MAFQMPMELLRNGSMNYNIGNTKENVNHIYEKKRGSIPETGMARNTSTLPGGDNPPETSRSTGGARIPSGLSGGDVPSINSILQQIQDVKLRAG